MWGKPRSDSLPRAIAQTRWRRHQPSLHCGRGRAVAELGLGGITLVEGQADNLSAFVDASINVVFTDAMLLYKRLQR
jgi:hypothetical protein